MTNAAPDAAADAVKADLAEISAGNGYTAGGITMSKTSSGETAGVYKLVLADNEVLAAGGTIGPFQWAVLYNDTPTSPADPLIGAWAYATAITLGDGEKLIIDASEANGVLQIT